MTDTALLHQEVESIFTTYKTRVYHLAIGILHNEKDAEDVVQNTFMKVLRNLPYFRHQSNISTWIYRIAYNESLMYWRKKYRQSRLTNRLHRETSLAPGGMFINWAKMPDKELLEAESKKGLEDAIRQIPIQYRMPLLLHHIEDMSLRQSAQVLGIKVSSLKSRLHRAVLMVGSAFSGYLKDKREAAEPQEKGCPLWVGFMYDYAKDRLDPRTKRRFTRHIVGCNGCSEFIQNYSKALAVTHALECRDIPVELQDKLRSFIRGHSSSASLSQPIGLRTASVPKR